MAKKPTFAIKPGQEASYAAYVKLNSDDDYSNAGVVLGEHWMELMEKRISENATSAQISKILKKSAWNDFGIADKDIGCSGFLYGCVVNALAIHWVYGAELWQWHMKTWKVANPAVVTVEIE